MIFVFKIQAAIDFTQTEALRLMKCRDPLGNALQLAVGLRPRKIALIFKAFSDFKRKLRWLGLCRWRSRREVGSSFRQQPRQGKTLPKRSCASLCVGGMSNDVELKLAGKMSYRCLALDVSLPSQG